MSDHDPRFASTGVLRNYEGDDEQYFALLAGDKPKPPTTNRPLEELPSKEIRESLESKIYSAPRGSPELVHEVHSDLGSCVFCSYQNFDRFTLGEHIRQHQEVIQFREVTNRQARRLESLRERQVQVRDSLERLKSESRQLDRQIAAFDKKWLEARQNQVTELIRLLSS